MKKVFILLLICIFLSPELASACGITLKSGSTGWEYGEDSSEHSFISYNDGIEDLIISRNFEASEQGVAWVIPIPAEPTTIQIDTIEELPQFSGELVNNIAKKTLQSIRNNVLLSQIWTYLPIQFVKTYSDDTLMSLAITPKLSQRISSTSVQIYSTISKGGITTQVITATSAQAIFEYLNKQGLSVPKESFHILDDYIGNNFSFITSWITSDESGVTKGVKMSFPTTEMFYPLKPGSVYKGAGLPETITIQGHVTPLIFANIKPYTTVEYYRSSRFPYFPSNEYKGENPYTKIIISAPPSIVTEDLSISPKTPVKIQATSALIDYPILFSIILFLLISLFTSIVSSFLLARRNLHFSQIVTLGFANTFTLLGVFLLSKRYKLSLWFSVVYSISFVVFVIVLIELLQLIV